MRGRLGIGIAVRAAALGRSTAARDQAELVVAADPGDGSARVALCAAADLGGDPATVGLAVGGGSDDEPQLIPAKLAETLRGEASLRVAARTGVV